jgi:hypothetical protein
MKDRSVDAVSEIIAVWYANHTKSIDTLEAYRELLECWSGVVRIVTIVLERITGEYNSQEMEDVSFGRKRKIVSDLN